MKFGFCSRSEIREWSICNFNCIISSFLSFVCLQQFHTFTVTLIRPTGQCPNVKRDWGEGGGTFWRLPTRHLSPCSIRVIFSLTISFFPKHERFLHDTSGFSWFEERTIKRKLLTWFQGNHQGQETRVVPMGIRHGNFRICRHRRYYQTSRFK